MSFSYLPDKTVLKNINEIILNGERAAEYKQDVIYGQSTAVYGIIRKVRESFEIINIRICGIEESIDEEQVLNKLLCEL